MSTDTPKRSWLRRTRRSVGVVTLFLLLCCRLVYRSYPGFTRDSLLMFSRSDHRDVASLYSYMLYYTGYFSRIRENSETGLYDMQTALEEANRDDAFELGMLSYHAGQFDAAITHMERAVEQKETEERLFWLALAYQRIAEQTNCAEHCRHADESARFCSLPIATAHGQPAPSEKAAAVLRKLLDNYDSDNKTYRWLLNFSHMTLGSFPDGVPAEYRLNGAFAKSFYDLDGKQPTALRFTECAAELNINTDDAGKGLAVEDFDRDGYLDIITGGNFQSVRYYRNVEGRTFEDVTVAAGLGDLTQPFIMTAADYDNDGWVDLFVSRPFHHFALLRNNGGTFVDVTFSAGLLRNIPKEDQILCTCMSAWGDVNNDGYLDLFAAHLGQRFPMSKGLLARKPISSRLYLNVPVESSGKDNKRRFVDVTEDFGLHSIVDDQIFFGAAFGDFDDDGWIDLFVSSPVLARSTLLKNQDGKRFVRSNQITTKRAGFTAAFLDINHDGKLDLFHGGHGPATRIIEDVVFDAGPTDFGSAIFVQEDSGTYRERRDLFSNEMAIGTMGTSFGDFNNDGAFEFYLGTGNPEPSFVLPNVMYLGELDERHPTGKMSNISMQHGFGTIQKGHGIVFFDFDNDGDQDMYSSLGGMWPGDSWPNQFFKNDTPSSNQWVKLRLRGRESNFYGVGAMIRIEAETEAGDEIVRYYYMNNKMGFGSAPYLAHVGLLDAHRISKVEVKWPSRTTRVYKNVQLHQLNILDEDGRTLVTPLPQAKQTSLAS